MCGFAGYIGYEIPSVDTLKKTAQKIEYLIMSIK